MQRATAAPGVSVAGSLLAAIRRRERRGAAADGSVGRGRWAPTVAELDLAAGEDLAVNGPLLAPGVGAQGGTAADVAPALRGCRPTGCCRRCRATCSAPGPTPAALRAAALR